VSAVHVWRCALLPALLPICSPFQLILDPIRNYRLLEFEIWIEWNQSDEQSSIGFTVFMKPVENFNTLC
jgi:hypothetical protein